MRSSYSFLAVALAGSAYALINGPEPTAPAQLPDVVVKRQQQPFSVNTFIPQAPDTDFLTGTGTGLGYRTDVNPQFLTQVAVTPLAGGATKTENAQLVLATGKVFIADELSVVFAPALHKQIVDLANQNLGKRELEERDPASLAVALLSILGSQSVPSLLKISKPAAFSIAQYAGKLIKFGPFTLALGAFIDTVINAVTLSHDFPGGIPPSVKVPLDIALGTKSCANAPSCSKCGGSDQLLYCKTGDFASCPCTSSQCPPDKPFCDDPKCVGDNRFLCTIGPSKDCKCWDTGDKNVGHYKPGFLEKQIAAMGSTPAPVDKNRVIFHVVYVAGPTIKSPSSQQALVVPAKQFDACNVIINHMDNFGDGSTLVNTSPASIPVFPSRLFDMSSVTIQPASGKKLCNYDGISLTFTGGNGKSISWSDKASTGATGGQCDIADHGQGQNSYVCNDGAPNRLVVQDIYQCRSTQNPTYCYDNPV
ncbi:MAG: hypothetical protein M1840_005185 [Geoglossum simile]|nr:MAG: hypothetical protein M1840_005185 [Geoglossum simile]